VAVICVFESTWNDAPSPLNRTAVAPVNAVPVMITVAFAAPVAGEKLVMPGVTRKLPALTAVPAGVVTLIFPDVAVAGTVTVMALAVTVLTVPALPLNFTALAPVKLLPVIVTSVFTAPLVGMKLVMRGATTKSFALVAVPPAVVTLIFPEVAFPG